MTEKKFIAAIPTAYRGVTFRSQLEAKYAKALDDLKIKWEYETKLFRLGTYRYLPDFWLPELHTFLEVKGPNVPGRHKTKRLAEMLYTSKDPFHSAKAALVVIGEADGTLTGVRESEEMRIARCRECQQYFIYDFTGSWGCRACHAHSGDHHIHGVYESMPINGRLRRI